jgi:tripartite-type tricarboxylate transporter receptor subunit TctC
VDPAGIPAERTKKLYQTLATVMANKELREALIRNGAATVGSSPAQLDRFLRAELDKWRKVIQFSGTKVEQ